MQQTIGLKRFVVTHLGPAMLAFVVLIVLAIGVVGLALSDNLPWTATGESHDAGSRPAILTSAPVERAAYVEQMQRFYQHKETRLEGAEAERSSLAAHAKRQDVMDRYVKHKEQTLDAPR